MWTTSPVSIVMSQSSGLSEEINLLRSELLSFSNLVKKMFWSLGSEVRLQPATWMGLQLPGLKLTAAILFRPCHAMRRLPWANVLSTLFLYLSLAFFMACLTSLLTSFLSNSEPVKKTLFFLFFFFSKSPLGPYSPRVCC